jgi:hypothetical protein
MGILSMIHGRDARAASAEAQRTRRVDFKFAIPDFGLRIGDRDASVCRGGTLNRREYSPPGQGLASLSVPRAVSSPRD